MPCLERGFVFQCFSLVQVFCYYNDYCYSSHVSHVRVWGGEEGQIVPEEVLELVGEFVLWDIVEDIVSFNGLAFARFDSSSICIGGLSAQVPRRWGVGCR